MKCRKCNCQITKDNVVYKNIIKAIKNNICKPCLAAQTRECYKVKKEKEPDYYKNRNQKALMSIKQRYIEYKKTLECSDCGCTDYRIMEFDHVHGQKTANISDLVKNNSWKSLMAEVAKCEPVCANCHRIRTYKRRKKDSEQP